MGKTLNLYTLKQVFSVNTFKIIQTLKCVLLTLSMWLSHSCWRIKVFYIRTSATVSTARRPLADLISVQPIAGTNALQRLTHTFPALGFFLNTSTPSTHSPLCQTLIACLSTLSAHCFVKQVSSRERLFRLNALSMNGSTDLLVFGQVDYFVALGGWMGGLMDRLINARVGGRNGLIDGWTKKWTQGRVELYSWRASFTKTCHHITLHHPPPPLYPYARSNHWDCTEMTCFVKMTFYNQVWALVHVSQWVISGVLKGEPLGQTAHSCVRPALRMGWMWMRKREPEKGQPVASKSYSSPCRM